MSFRRRLALLGNPPRDGGRKIGGKARLCQVLVYAGFTGAKDRGRFA